MKLKSATIDRTAILQHADQARKLRPWRRNRTDKAALRIGDAIGRDVKIINLADVLHAGGLDERRRPRLAFASSKATVSKFEGHLNRFNDDDRSTGITWVLPQFVLHGHTVELLEAPVPAVPAPFRPTGSLSDYVTLFEPDWTPVPAAPADPAILKRIHGWLYEVIATWDITAIERALLGEFSYSATREEDARKQYEEEMRGHTEVYRLQRAGRPTRALLAGDAVMELGGFETDLEA